MLFEVIFSPLSHAEHRGIERKSLADLFERSAFPRDPFLQTGSESKHHAVSQGVQ